MRTHAKRSRVIDAEQNMRVQLSQAARNLDQACARANHLAKLYPPVVVLPNQAATDAAVASLLAERGLSLE